MHASNTVNSIYLEPQEVDPSDLWNQTVPTDLVAEFLIERYESFTSLFLEPSSMTIVGTQRSD